MQVPPEVYDLFGHAGKQGAEAEKKWQESWQQYKSKYAEVNSPITQAQANPALMWAQWHSLQRPLWSLFCGIIDMLCGHADTWQDIHG